MVPRRASPGFTLLEVLVVLAIVGIIVSFAVISIGGDGRLELAEREAKRLAARVDLAGDEAVLRGRELGVRFSDRDYRFLMLETDAWIPLADDPVFAPRPLEAALRLRLRMEDREVALGPAETDAPAPQVLLLSSGERTPFTADFLTEVGGSRVRLGAVGRPALERLEAR